MFKNPLKYQQGGQLNEQQQQMLAAFIDWLPKRVKEFQGMKPEAIVQALDGMSKTSEGQKQVQQLMEQFQQELQGGSQAFRQGGKIHDFICKHAKGGYVSGCGCKDNGGKMQSGGIVVDDPSYDKVISAPGDTLSTKRYKYSTQTRRTLPSGSIIYSRDTRNGTDNYWDPRYPQPDWWRRTLYGMRPAPIEFYQNWDDIESNHRGEVTKDKTQKEKCGGKVKKGQDGSVIDYYKDKWNNDWNHIKQAWGRFKESAPGKVWGAFMPNPNSEAGMLGAAAPIGKIKVIPEGVSGTEKAAKWVAEHTSETPHIADLPPRQIDETQGAKIVNGLREWLYGKWYNGR